MKLKSVYVCSNCGETSPRWMGRCPSCGSWNTMTEDVVAEAPKAGTPAARQAELLRYYLEAWQGLFAPGSMQGTVQLFSMEYLALGLVVSLFLVLGLSALGPVMIFGSMMLYGLGSGLLMVQLCTAGGWKTMLLALLWTGLPAAAASGCLCFFGACALQVSSRIHAYSFRKHSGGQARPGVQTLLGQYLLTMVVLLPLCGAAAGLSYLGSRL